MATNQNYYSQTLIVKCKSTKVLAAIKKFLILVIIRQTQNTMITQAKYLLEK